MKNLKQWLQQKKAHKIKQTQIRELQQFEALFTLPADKPTASNKPVKSTKHHSKKSTHKTEKNSNNGDSFQSLSFRYEADLFLLIADNFIEYLSLQDRLYRDFIIKTKQQYRHVFYDWLNQSKVIQEEPLAIKMAVDFYNDYFNTLFGHYPAYDEMPSISESLSQSRSIRQVAELIPLSDEPTKKPKCKHQHRARPTPDFHHSTIIERKKEEIEYLDLGELIKETQQKVDKAFRSASPS
jgi:hypothetical protein